MVADHQGCRDQSGINVSARLTITAAADWRYSFLSSSPRDARSRNRRADKAVVTGDVAGDAAYGCALEAALCVGGGTDQSNCQRQSGAGQKSLHWQNSVTACFNPRQCHSFPTAASRKCAAAIG
jgi:hypothetical protein